MPGKTKIPRTTMAAGSNRINSNFANKLDYNPVVKAMRTRIDSLEKAKNSLIITNNNLVNKLNISDICNNPAFDASMADLHINNLVYTISGSYYTHI